MAWNEGSEFDGEKKVRTVNWDTLRRCLLPLKKDTVKKKVDPREKEGKQGLPFPASGGG